MPCLCGLPAPTDRCCGRFCAGDEWPATAEQLMRSRYVAYVEGDIDYILRTHDPATAHTVDRGAAADWSRTSEWLGLEVLATEAGQPDDSTGTVEFIARYRTRGQVAAHHERSNFRKIDGHWHYTDGTLVKPAPVTRDAPKVGRNDPCPCGSGLKHKKCCGA
ncbi:MAG: YchJ family protein [Candidatus Xenobia bacterium]